MNIYFKAIQHTGVNLQAHNILFTHKSCLHMNTDDIQMPWHVTIPLACKYATGM